MAGHEGDQLPVDGRVWRNRVVERLLRCKREVAIWEAVLDGLVPGTSYGSQALADLIKVARARAGSTRGGRAD